MNSKYITSTTASHNAQLMNDFLKDRGKQEPENTLEFRDIPIDWFVCPDEKTALSLSGDQLLTAKNRYYEKDENNGFWNFIPKNLEIFDNEAWATWNILQDNGVTTYNNDPLKNLGVGPRQDFLDFAQFCNFKGAVLDIGVGPQKCPTHIQYTQRSDIFFVGVDPLAGEQPRDFAFVQALGEYLPFKAGIFDQVLFVTSLDHFIDPVVALKEAKRVMKKKGEMCIWLGEKDKNAPKPAQSPDWYENLQIPPGAEDRFHFRRFSIDEFESYLPTVGLTIKESRVLTVDQWRKNCFYKLTVPE